VGVELRLVGVVVGMTDADGDAVRVGMRPRFKHQGNRVSVSVTAGGALTLTAVS
jgi:hypothetical protein